MRHRKDTFKIGRTSSHNRCLIANMLKSLVEYEKIETTVRKAKKLKQEADKLVTLLKKENLNDAKALLMIRFNKLSSKERKEVKDGNLRSCNGDRKVFKKLLTLKDRFLKRNGGYTRIIKKDFRVGDRAPLCYIEFVE